MFVFHFATYLLFPSVGVLLPQAEQGLAYTQSENQPPNAFLISVCSCLMRWFGHCNFLVVLLVSLILGLCCTDDEGFGLKIPSPVSRSFSG